MLDMFLRRQRLCRCRCALLCLQCLLLIASRQCRQYPLLITSRLLFDLVVLVLVDIQFLPGFVWADCRAAEEELDQSRAYLFGRTACGLWRACLPVHGDG